MSDKVTITLEVRDDGASRTFKVVGDAAETMGDVIDKVSSEGSRSFKELGDSTSRLEGEFDHAAAGTRSFTQGLDAANINAAATSQNFQDIANVLTNLGHAALENERLTTSLGKAYGDAGQDMIEFSNHMQDVTKFSNDAAQQSLLLANSLSQNYQIPAQDIQALTMRAADMAAMFGMELPDAMSRLAGAIRGEGEAAEALGLNMSDAAVQAEALKRGIEGWNVPGALTEAEKAAFRFQLVMEQSAFATGTAEQAAQGADGTYARLTNTFQDGAAALGEMLGPIPMVAAGLANVASTAYTTIGGVTAMLGVLGKARAGLQSASLALGAMGIAAGPVGLAIAGLGLAAGAGLAIWQRYKSNVDENAAALELLAAEAAETEDIISRLTLSGQFDLADQITQQYDAAAKAIESFNQRIPQEFSDVQWFAGIDFATKTVEESVGHFVDFLNKDVAEGFAEWAVTTKALGDDTQQILRDAAAGNETTLQIYGKQIQDAVKDYLEHLKIDDSEKAAVNASLNDLFELYSNPSIDSSKLDAVISDYIQNLSDGTISSEEFSTALENLLTGIKSGADPFNVLTESAEELRTALDGLSDRERSFAWMVDDLELQGLGDLADQIRTIDSLIGDLSESNAEWALAYNSSTVNDLAIHAGLTAEQLDLVWAAQDRLNQKIREGSIDGQLVIDALTELNHQYETGAITSDQYAAAIVTMASNTSQFAVETDAAGASAQKFFTILNEGIDSVINKVSQNLPEQSFLDKLLGSTGLTDTYDVDAFLSDPKLPWNRPIPPPSDEALDSKDEWIAYINEVPQFSDEWYARTEEYRQWGEEQAAANDAILDEEKQHNADMAEEQERRANERKAKWEEERAAQKAEIDARKAMVAEFMQAGMDLMGVDTFPEQLNLAGIGTEYTQLAADINQANESLEAGFRITVGNTNAIAQNAQAVQDWADELIGAEGTWAKIDDLLASGAISQNEYNAAQGAYNDIAAANLSIQEDILAIQAKQAPVLAELTQNQADYVDALADMPAEQQAIALGWMDANTAMQANQAIALATAAANGELGESGKAAAQAYIDGAIAANPYLEAMLRDIGLINEDGTINFAVAEGTMSDLDRLTASITALVDLMDNGVLDGSFSIDVEGEEDVENATTALNDADGKTATSTYNIETKVNGDIGTTLADAMRNAMGAFGGGDSDGTGGAEYDLTATATIDAEDNASETIGTVASLLEDADGDLATLLIEADNNGALDKINETESEHGALDGDRSVMEVDGDIDGAMSAFAEVERRHRGLDGDASTMYVEGDASDAYSAIDSIQAYDGVTIATSYYQIHTIYTSSGSSGGGGQFIRHGGMPGFAHGGMVPFVAGEAGIELAHLANGGIVPILEHGLYAAPPGTAITPAPAAAATLGGLGDIHVGPFIVQGNVYDTNDLALSLAPVITAAVSEGVEERRRALGGG